MAKYHVLYDRAANVLHFGMTGHWTMEDIPAFAAALVQVVNRIPGTQKTYDALSDTSAFPVQSAEVSQALGQIMKVGLKTTTGRTAVVVASMLNKLQAERTLAGDRVKVFLRMDEAKAWLAER